MRFPSKLLKLLGFGRCSSCGKIIYNRRAKKARFTDSPKDGIGYLGYVCDNCYWWIEEYGR